MQKIFIVGQEPISRNEKGNNFHVNEFIGAKGKIISVTTQHVSGNDQRGRWLVVADDGKKR